MESFSSDSLSMFIKVGDDLLDSVGMSVVSLMMFCFGEKCFVIKA